MDEIFALASGCWGWEMVDVPGYGAVLEVNDANSDFACVSWCFFVVDLVVLFTDLAADETQRRGV